jgi:starch-binding outer membrane protein, SusD/RagB family
LEFGHEGIRKYDLLRWNLLGAKIAETRAAIRQIRDRTGRYANVPQFIYWRNSGEEIQYFAGAGAPTNAQPFWRPTQIPSPLTGWTRTDWSQNLTANAIDGRQLWEGFASFFAPGKSELFPYDQVTLASYQGKLKQNPGY